MNNEERNLKMTDEEACLNTQLYEKICSELSEFEEELRSQTSDEILSSAYEYTVKQDIVFAIEEYDLPEKQAEILLKSDNALNDIFTKFETSESGYMDHIRDMISATANEKLREAFLKARSKTEER